MRAHETQEKETASGGWSHLLWSGYTPILLGVMAGLVACGLIALGARLLEPRQADIQPAMRAVCADLMGQRYDDLYSLLAPALQAQGTEAQFVASQREVDQLQGQVTACEPGTPSVNGAQAIAPFTLTRAESFQPVAAQVALTLSDGTWRIASYSGAF
jgi:hypothetical protein